MIFNRTHKPPLGTQINWGHPLARGLVGCWLMDDGIGAGGYITNRATGRSLIAVGSPKSCISLDGPSLDKRVTDATNYFVTGSEDGSEFCLTNNWSIFAAYTCVETAWQCIFQSEYSVENRIGLWLNSSNEVTIVCGTSNVAGSATSVNNNVRSIIGVIHSQAADYTYKDGIYAPTGFAVLSNATTPHISAQIGFSVCQGGYTMRGMLGWLYIWDRALLPLEAMMFEASPYAMFNRRPVWMDYAEPPTETEYRILYHNHYQQMRIV